MEGKIRSMAEARFYMKFDKDANMLIVEVTENIAFKVMRSLRTHLWPEIENMKLEIVNHTNEEGYLYKEVRRYTIPIYADRVAVYFEAAQHQLTESIKRSIANSDN